MSGTVAPARPGRRRLFELVVMVDWSAAGRPGPPRETADQIWLAWGDARSRPPPRYCRTRADACALIHELVAAEPGSALVGFDFPFGYPAGSGLGGGRRAAAMLAALIDDRPDNGNNRFAVASRLNQRLGAPPGPFWMCPAGQATAALPVKRPDFARFARDRVVERVLRAQRRRPHSVWQLCGAGSVGSQVLLGLPAIHRLVTVPALAPRARIWPFDTGWDRALDGIVFAEIWPSLYDFAAQPHPVKDARQVAAVRDRLLDLDRAGGLRRLLARPAGLDAATATLCRTEEGWIVGVEPGVPAACAADGARLSSLDPDGPGPVAAGAQPRQARDRRR